MLYGLDQGREYPSCIATINRIGASRDSMRSILVGSQKSTTVSEWKASGMCWVAVKSTGTYYGASFAALCPPRGP